MASRKRRRNRAGRPRKNQLPRLGNGRLKRGRERKKADTELTLIEQKENKSVVVEARQRVFGLTEQLADSQDGGDIARVMLLRGAKKYSDAAKYFEAIDEIRRCHAAHQRAILCRGVPSAGDLSRQPGFDDSDGTDPAYVATFQRSVRQWKEIRRAILECGQPMAMMAVETIIFEEKPAWQLLGDMRCALNAVNRVLRLENAA